ncbi:MAG: hypothetical protein FD167_2418 [bacterium]|nr:MAG: hypothetical protein FD167_2418 [bacterium]
MTNEEIQKLMEFIVTQQAEITVKQSQLLDIHFETAKRQAEFEKLTENRIQFIIEHQAEFDNKLERLADNVKDLTEGLRSVSKRVEKLEDNKKEE